MLDPGQTTARGRGGLCWALEILGLVLLALSALADARSLYESPVSAYDEGFHLTNATLIARGEIPYRDFYSNYPPGAFATIAALWKLTGPSVLAGRVFGWAIHGALAILAGRLVARLNGRRFSLLGAGLTAAWLSHLGLFPSAWLWGLTGAFAFVILLARAIEAPTRPRWLGAGVTLGVTSWYRHDLVLCLIATLLLIALAAVWRASTDERARIRDGGLWLAVGLLLTAVPVWGMLFALAGRRVLFDLLIDQVRYVVPGRRLPLPPFLPLTPLGLLQLPAALVVPYSWVVAASLAGPALAAVMIAARRRWPLASPPTTVAVGALSVAVLPHLLTRADFTHGVEVVIPALVLATALAQALASRSRAGAAASVVLAALLVLPVREVAQRHAPTWRRYSTRGFPRYGGIPEWDGPLLEVVDYLQRHTSPEQRIFVGLASHVHTHGSHMLLYFLSDRRGGTRYMQFDPNLTNREDVQREMIADLESRRVEWAVRLARWDDIHEANASASPGSDALDRYLALHFEPVARFGDYTVERRRAIAEDAK
jgi:hypothetical protein